MADPTIIAPDTVISGRLEGSDDLTVQGHVDGSIELSETLTIDLQGRVDGDVRAREVVVEGALNGELIAEERVILTATARAIANIEAPLIEMADGAQLQGELSIGVDAKQAPAAGTRSSTTRQRTSTASRTASSSTVSTSSTPSTRAPTSRATATAPASGTATTTTVVEESATSASEEQQEEPKQAEDEGLLEEQVEQYHEDFTVKELREKLRDRDLRVSGTKDELIERLMHAETQTGS